MEFAYFFNAFGCKVTLVEMLPQVLPVEDEEIARTLERGKFHLAFFDDRLSMPDRYGDDHVHAVENGIRVVKLDPVACMMAMAFS